MAIGYSLRMCALNSTNPGRSNLVFRSKPIAEAEMSKRLIQSILLKLHGLKTYMYLFSNAYSAVS